MHKFRRIVTGITVALLFCNAIMTASAVSTDGVKQVQSKKLISTQVTKQDTRSKTNNNTDENNSQEDNGDTNEGNLDVEAEITVEKTDIEWYAEEHPKIRIYGTVYTPSTVKHDEVYMFFHGRMGDNEDAHKGFDYVIEELNKLGYRAISVNIHELYQGTGHSTDLEMKIFKAVTNVMLNNLKDNNFKNIETSEMSELILIGHSRSGYHIFNLAKDIIDNHEHFNVKQMISIAPYMIDEAKRSSPDVDTTIIVPEYDGDVRDLDGIKFYTIEKENTSKMQLDRNLRYIYLLGGNHNYFSTEMRLDDGDEVDGDGKNRISKESQMEFFRNIMLKYTTNEDVEIEQDHTCIEHSREWQRLKIYESEMLGKNVEVSSVKVDPKKHSGIKKSWFTQPGIEEVRDYTLLEFSDAGEFILDIANLKVDRLSFDMALDITREYSSDVKVQIKAIYTNGECEKLTTQLLGINGKLIKEYGAVKISRYTPIEQFMIDMDIDKNVTKLVIEVNKGCRILLEGINIDIWR